MPKNTVSDPRAAIEEKLVGQQAEGLRTVNPGRDQILARLWELANLSPEATRGSMAGQIKALAMIIAIEGLIPDRRRSAVPTPPAVSPVPRANIYKAEWLRQQQQEAESNQSSEPADTAEDHPGPSQAPQPPASVTDLPATHPDASQLSMANPFVHPQKSTWVPGATGVSLDVFLDQTHSERLPFSPRRGYPGQRR